MNAAGIAAAQGDWQARGRVLVPGVWDPEQCAAAALVVRARPVVASVRPGGWVWFEAGDAEPAWVSRVQEVAAAVIGRPVVVGEAGVRRFPRGTWADVDPRGVGLVGFSLELSEPGVVGGARRFGDDAWPPTRGALGLWWDDGVSPAGVDLVYAGERLEITGVLGAPG